MHIPHGGNNAYGPLWDRMSRRARLDKWIVYSAVRIPHNAMIIKMLILLVFFAEGRGSFIHSDIHRRVMHVEEYAVQKVCAQTQILAQ